MEVSAIYPGANAQVVADTVAAPIEQQVNGVEDMMYMSSQCTNDGSYTLTVTFKHGVDLNIAQVLVQNRVSLAQPILPDLVKRRGVTVKKKSPSVLMIVNLFSPDGNRNRPLPEQLRHHPDQGRAVPSAGRRRHHLSGPARLQHAHLARSGRRWHTRNLTAGDVIQAIAAAEHPGGGRPDRPAARRQRPGLPVHHEHDGPAGGRRTVRDIILKTDRPGPTWSRAVRDVAERIELGAQSYDQTCTLDGQPSVALSIYQLPGSNALDTRQARQGAKMKELKERFPDGVDYDIVYDTTPFINESITEVFKTLRDAIILVADRRAAVPAELALGHHSAGRRAGGHHRHLRRHGGDGLQPE